MLEEKIRLNLYHNESEEALRLEQELRARGNYELKVTHCSRKEPVVITPAHYLTSWRAICDILNVYPFRK